MLEELKKAVSIFTWRECDLTGQIVISGKTVDYWITACYKGFFRVAIVQHAYHDVNNLSFSSVPELVKFIAQKERCANKVEEKS